MVDNVDGIGWYRYSNEVSERLKEISIDMTEAWPMDWLSRQGWERLQMAMANSWQLTRCFLDVWNGHEGNGTDFFLNVDGKTSRYMVY